MTYEVSKVEQGNMIFGYSPDDISGQLATTFTNKVQAKEQSTVASPKTSFLQRAKGVLSLGDRRRGLGATPQPA